MKRVKIGIMILIISVLVGCKESKSMIPEAVEGTIGQEKITITPYPGDTTMDSETLPNIPLVMDQESMVFAVNHILYEKKWDEKEGTLRKKGEILSRGKSKEKSTIKDLSLEEGLLLSIDENQRATLFKDKEGTLLQQHLSFGMLLPKKEELLGIKNHRIMKGTIKDGQVEKMEAFPLPGLMDPHVSKEKNLTTLHFMNHSGDQILVGGKTKDDVSMVYVYNEDGTPIMYLGGTWGHMTGAASGAKVKDRYYIVDTTSNILLLYNDQGGEIGWIHIGELFKDKEVFLRSVASFEDRLYGGFAIKNESGGYEVFIGELKVE